MITSDEGQEQYDRDLAAEYAVEAFFEQASEEEIEAYGRERKSRVIKSVLQR
jgi:hypothetical protein